MSDIVFIVRWSAFMWIFRWHVHREITFVIWLLLRRYSHLNQWQWAFCLWPASNFGRLRTISSIVCKVVFVWTQTHLSRAVLLLLRRHLLRLLSVPLRIILTCIQLEKSIFSMGLLPCFLRARAYVVLIHNRWCFRQLWESFSHIFLCLVMGKHICCFHRWLVLRQLERDRYKFDAGCRSCAMMRRVELAWGLLVLWLRLW